MTKTKQATKSVKPAPVELHDEALDRVAGGVDPSNPNVVFVGGSRRYATGKSGSGTG